MKFLCTCGQELPKQQVVYVSRLDPSQPWANSANTLSDGRRTQQTSPFSIINSHPPTRPPLEAQLRMLCYTIVRITLQAATKSKLRATHIHHGQVSNIIKDISNTDKRTIHNNTSKHATYVNTQHHVTAWTVTVGSPQYGSLMYFLSVLALEECNYRYTFKLITSQSWAKSQLHFTELVLLVKWHGNVFILGKW